MSKIKINLDEVDEPKRFLKKNKDFDDELSSSTRLIETDILIGEEDNEDKDKGKEKDEGKDKEKEDDEGKDKEKEDDEGKDKEKEDDEGKDKDEDKGKDKVKAKEFKPPDPSSILTQIEILDGTGQIVKNTSSDCKKITESGVNWDKDCKKVMKESSD